jgi:hypothetical protein
VKVLTKEQAETLKKAGVAGSGKKRYRATRRLSETELAMSNRDQRCRLETQGVRANKNGPLLPPGHTFSVQLQKCGHRARVDVLASGFLPRRAKCPTCRRWRNTIAETARRPVRAATRTIVDKHTEERDGRTFTVSVLATPRRAKL